MRCCVGFEIEAQANLTEADWSVARYSQGPAHIELTFCMHARIAEHDSE